MVPRKLRLPSSIRNKGIKMKRGLTIIALLLFVLAAQPLFAADDPVVGTKEFEKAMDLYIQAVPLELNSPERVVLLNDAQKILTKLIEEYPDTLEARRKLLGVHLLQKDYSRVFVCYKKRSRFRLKIQICIYPWPSFMNIQALCTAPRPCSNLCCGTWTRTML